MVKYNNNVVGINGGNDYKSHSGKASLGDDI